MSNKAFDDMSPAEQKAHLLRRSEEIDRQAKPAKRREVPDVPEKVLLALDGKKAGSDIIFGPEGKTQLIFRPSKGRMKGLARWTVFLKGNTSRHDLQRELNKGTRGLWDKEKGEPSVAFKAVEQLLHCYIEIRRQFRRTLLLFLLRRFREEAKQDGEAAEDALYIYPKPQVETLREELATARAQLETVSEQRLRDQGAICLVVEALSKGPLEKLGLAFDLLWDEFDLSWDEFDLLWDDSQLPQDVMNLQFQAWRLAGKLQRPPTKAELRKRYNSKYKAPAAALSEKDFSPLLKHAGLSWLHKGPLKIPNFP